MNRNVAFFHNHILKKNYLHSKNVVHVGARNCGVYRQITQERVGGITTSADAMFTDPQHLTTNCLLLCYSEACLNMCIHMSYVCTCRKIACSQLRYSATLMVHNFYDVLLVAPTATSDEIRAAFKRRALQVHPDKGSVVLCLSISSHSNQKA